MNNETITEPLLGSWFGIDNATIVGLSVLFASLIVIAIVIIGHKAYNKWIKDKTRKDNVNYRLRDVIYDANGFPSLSKFQFLLWTLIVLFSFITVGFIRILGGYLGEDWAVNIPQNLIYLMGISLAVVPVASYMTKNKYGETAKPPSNQVETEAYLKNEIYWYKQNSQFLIKSKGKTENPAPRRTKPPELPKRVNKPFWSMITEGGAPSLTKFQMFSWTWIAVGIYFLTFVRLLFGFASSELPVTELLLPDVSSTLVALMGVSQGAYLGGKWIAPKTPSINTISPESASVGTSITIRGVNFGDAQDGSSIKINNIDVGKATKWEDTVIDFIIPSAVKTGVHPLVVIVGGNTAKTTITVNSLNNISNN